MARLVGALFLLVSAAATAKESALASSLAAMRAELAALRIEVSELRRQQRTDVDPCATERPSFAGEVTVFPYNGYNRLVERGSSEPLTVYVSGSLVVSNYNATTGMFDFAVARTDVEHDDYNFICSFGTSESPHSASCVASYEEPDRPVGPGWQQLTFRKVKQQTPGGPCVAGDLTTTGMYFFDEQQNSSGVYSFSAP